MNDVMLYGFLIALAALSIVIFAIPAFWAFGNRQERRIKRLRLEIEEKKLRQTILEMEGRTSEDGWRHK